MRFFYDTEFIEDGDTIELISIGIVGDDGREYYAVSTDFDPNSSEWKSLDTIRTDLEEFLHVPGGAELWAWVGCYDHVVLAQLWGDMPALPRHIPRFTRELKQYWEFAGKPQLPDLESGKHNALEDARHNVRKFQACMAALPIGAKGHVLPPN